MPPNSKKHHSRSSSYQPVATTYGSLLNGVENGTIQEDEYEPPTFGAAPRLSERKLSFLPQIVSEPFTPLYRTVSIRAEKVIAEQFTPLYRTVSEGVQTLAHPSFVLSEKALDPNEDRRRRSRGGTSSIASEIANLSKNTIGGGVMSLSGGIALFASDPQAAVYAVAWIVVLGVLFGYFCLLTGKSCDLSLSGTYRECWERTVGSKGGIFVALATTLDPLMALFCNSAILSQSLRFTLRGLGINLSIPECLLLLATCALLPLCLMQNLNALAPFSAMGICAVFVSLGCMIVRYLDGSYLPGGQFHDQILSEYRPHFGTDCSPFSARVLPFVCMVFMSYDMHYNSPRFYTELKDATPARFATVCACAFGLVSFLYLTIAVVGFWTFGAHSDSFILDNYSARDPLAAVARLCMGFSALLTYPLNFIGLRDNLLDLLGLTDKFNTPAKLRVFIVLLLSVCVGMACFITDLGLITSVGGGTSVALVAFVLPAFMFKEAVRNYYYVNYYETKTFWVTAEVWMVMILMVCMVVLGISGVIASLNRAQID